MDKLIIALFSGLAVAIITGLTLLAVKYPDIYKDLYFKFIGFILSVYVAFSIWVVAYNAGFVDFSRAAIVDCPTLSSIKSKYPDIYILYLFIGYFVLFGYIMFLSYLSQKIKSHATKVAGNATHKD